MVHTPSGVQNRWHRSFGESSTRTRLTPATISRPNAPALSAPTPFWITTDPVLVRMLWRTLVTYWLVVCWFTFHSYSGCSRSGTNDPSSARCEHDGRPASNATNSRSTGRPALSLATANPPAPLPPPLAGHCALQPAGAAASPLAPITTAASPSRASPKS